MAWTDEDGDERAYPDNDSASSIDASDYIANWSGSGDFWDTVGSSDGIPYPKLGKLLAAVGGGIGLAWTYWIIGPIRMLSVKFGDAIDKLGDFGGDVSTKVIDIPSGYFVTASEQSSTYVGSQGVAGFAYAFGIVLVMATIVWLFVQVVSR